MMTEKLAGMSSLKNTVKKTVPPAEAERVAMRELVKVARAHGEDHRGGTGGLLSPPRSPLRPAYGMSVTVVGDCVARRGPL
jgi:hypothetical protein